MPFKYTISLYLHILFLKSTPLRCYPPFPPHFSSLSRKVLIASIFIFFYVVHPRCVLRSQFLGYGKYISQTQIVLT
jgi:hypothetical protein